MRRLLCWLPLNDAQSRHENSNVMHCFRMDPPTKWTGDEKSIFSGAERRAGFLCVWQECSSGRCPCLLLSKNKVSAPHFLPFQQTNKADVILCFLKAWSEQVRVRRTRRKKYTRRIISSTMALCRISRDAFTAFSQPRPTLTPSFVPHPGDREGEFNALSSVSLKFYGNLNKSCLLADGLNSTLSA